MGLKDLDCLEPSYNSDVDDILNDFYIPLLKQSSNYYRLAGFFSSSSLAVAARGIKGLLENDGRIKLIAGAILNPEDINAIRQGLEDPYSLIQMNIIKDLDNIESHFIKNHVQALGWMIANNRMEIRLAIVKDDDGLPLDSLAVNQCGIFHQKIGILSDFEDNMISFSGSINETASAWKENIEEFKIFRNWVEAERPHFSSDYASFFRYWNRESDKVEILEIPEAIRKHLIKMAPSDPMKLDLDDKKNLIDKESNVNEYISNKFRDSIIKDVSRLRYYQREAITNWRNNGCKGILEMATASGKTFTAIIGSYFLYKEKNRLCTIILVPSKELVNQWGNEIKKYTTNVVEISSAKKGWKVLLLDYVYLFMNARIDHVYIVSTIDSFVSVERIISKIPNKEKLLIADEAHWIGTSETRRFLGSHLFDYTLGLTATPVRYFDEDGTEFLYSYLGKTVFSFSIKDGQEKGYLCRYKYHIEFCGLDLSELENYIQLTRSIIKCIAGKEKNQISEDDLTKLLNRRAKIIKDAKSKFGIFDKLLSSLTGSIDKCVVYCDESQMDVVCSILRKHDLIFNTFLGGTSDSERRLLISSVKSGLIDAVVAIKCLNEGIDIPPLRSGFFLSNSGNPREFIQRRGRLLRTCEGKTIVDIYDFIVIPNINNVRINADEEKLIRNIITKELERVKDFNKDAINCIENERKIFKEINRVLF